MAANLGAGIVMGVTRITANRVAGVLTPMDDEFAVLAFGAGGGSSGSPGGSGTGIVMGDLRVIGSRIGEVVCCIGIGCGPNTTRSQQIHAFNNRIYYYLNLFRLRR